MQKYIVTVVVNGLESPITVRAKDKSIAIKQASSKGAKVVSVMTKEDYKKKYKSERQSVSSIEVSHRAQLCRANIR